MAYDTISKLPDPTGISPDPLTEVLRDGARKLIEKELATLTAALAGEKLKDGRARLVRHGYLPAREVITGIASVPVTLPRVRDRKPGAHRVTFKRRGLKQDSKLAIGDGAPGVPDCPARGLSVDGARR